MNTGRTAWWTMVVSALASFGSLLATHAADDNLAQDPYMKVAVARTRVEISLRDLAPAFVPAENGWTVAWAATERAKGHISTTISRAQNKEQQRGDNQNEQFVADCEQRNATYEEEWGQLCNATRPAMESRLEQVSTQFCSARDVFNNLAGMEPTWKAAKLDLSVLESVYGTLEKRVLDLRSQMDALVKEAQGHQAKWEGEIKLVEEVMKQGQ